MDETKVIMCAYLNFALGGILYKVAYILFRDRPPDVVTFPRSTSEVSTILRLCNERKVPVVPFGAGTGLESGVSAVQVNAIYIVSHLKEH